MPDLSENLDSDYPKVRKHKPDYKIILYVGLLALLGLIIIFAIGPQRANVLNNAYGSNFSSSYFFIKQLASILLSVCAFSVAAFLPYQFILKKSNYLMIAGFLACVILAIASWMHLPIAQETLGATRWFRLGALGTIQPSEILKLGMMLFFATFLGTRYKKGKQNDFNETLMPIAVLSGLALLIIVVVQRDLGTGVSLIGIILSMLFVSKINLKNSLIILSIVVLAGVLFIFSASHRIDRVMTFFKGDSTSSTSSDGGSYHIEQARLAIGTGGLFGVGIGRSVQSTGYLPEATNDSIFAIIGETFGFVGLVTILALFCALLLQLLKQMDHQSDMRLRLVIAGVFGWLFSHVVLNVASMTGLMPLTGITLPFLSIGGTSLLFISTALGIIFQLSYYSVNNVNIKEDGHENFGSRRGIGRSRYSGRSSYTRN